MYTSLNAPLARCRQADLLAEAERSRRLHAGRLAPRPPAWPRVVVARMLVAAARRLDPLERIRRRRAAGRRIRRAGALTP
jgi:hypothetical protein